MDKVEARLRTRFIRECSSWDDLYEKLKVLVATSKKEAGDTFEVFVQAYLRTSPEYQALLSDVWLLNEVPPEVRKRLGDLFQSGDEGTDLIARTRRGQLWAIQAKFVGDPDQALTRSKVDSFLSYGFFTLRDKFALGLIAHISTRPIKKRRLMPNIRELGLDRWRALDDNGGAGWRAILRTLKRGEPEAPRKKKPWPHVRRAVAAAVKHFERAARGRLKMACGTGKSLVGLLTARALKAETILVVTPSLQLVQRAVEDWSREYLANGEKPDWMCVCSDDTVVDNVDDFVTDAYESGLPTTTDPREVAERLRAKGTKIVFATYQSSEVVAEAARLARVTFDFALFDEAHKTVGRREKAFGRLLRSDFKAKRRMFMTATERIVNGGDAGEVYSMDSEEDYGARFHTLEFAEAIERGLISPFKVLTVKVSEKRIKNLIDENRILNVAPGLEEVEARELAVAVALNEAIERHEIKKSIAYCANIAAGKRARDQQDELGKLGRWPATANFHVSSELTAGERADIIREFEDATQPAIMYNARCLTEGVDIGTQKGRPIDAVAFTSPRRSVIDIVQAAGRAMRKGGEKKVGYILIPIIVPDNATFNKFAETTPFKEMARIIRALALADPRIVDELRALYYGKVPSSNIIEIEGDESISLRMPFDEFASALQTKVWEIVARGNWMPFEEARAFTRKLNLKSLEEWKVFARSSKRPKDIPMSPDIVYADWKSWPDFLGHGNYKYDFRSFEEACKFARTLRLQSRKQWLTWAHSNKRPDDIPMHPSGVYANAGWKGWDDFLGTGFNGWLPFEEARAFARKLKLNSSEWREYCHSGKKPNDIPPNPHYVYANTGWKNWPDWLDSGRAFRPFKQARSFVRKLKLKSGEDWRKYCQSGKRPEDIPSSPRNAYSDDWNGWDDFLGTGRNRYCGSRRPFKQARAFARTLGLSSGDEWIAYNKRPREIPKYPNKAYINFGWNGWLDFLGKTKRRQVSFRSFKDARTFARRLQLGSVKEWFDFNRSGKRPKDVPANPSSTYADDGWKGWTDWLDKIK